VVYRPDTTVAGNRRIVGSFSGGTGTQWVIYNQSGAGYKLFSSAFAAQPARYQWDLANDVVVLGARRESDTQWTLWRGNQKHQTTTIADHTLTDNPLRIGQEFIGRIGEVVGFGSALSDANMSKVGGFLLAKWGDGYPVNLAFEGDSQTSGVKVGAADASLDNLLWPTQVRTLLGEDSRFSIANMAVGGSNFSTLESRAAALDATVSTHALNVLTVWCGTNETTVPGNAATTHASLRAYCLARRAAGWDKIIVATAMARGDQPNEPWRSSFNGLIRANYTQYADALIDVAANANLGGGTSYLTSYFDVDQIHLSPTGCVEMASIAAPVIDAVIPD
jgi:lysophospholipase L1-like esterase